MPFAHNQDTQIYWREQGTGEPLLLIMGLGYPSGMWHHIESQLARDFRVIVFDNRGIGRSDTSHGVQHIATMAEDARAVLDAADVAMAHVFGMSMGGFIAQELALNHPARVRKLILGCTHFGGSDITPADDEVLETLLARADMTPEDGVRVMVPFIYDATTPAERIESDIRIRLADYPDREVYLGQIEGSSQWSSKDRLPGLRHQTLVIHGEHDRLIPAVNGERLAGLIVNSQFRLMKQASHIFITDQPTQSVETIRAFIAS